MQFGKVMRDEAKGMIQAIQQGFGALIDARINGSENYLSDVYKQSALRHGEVMAKQQAIQKITPYAVELVAILGLLFILFLFLQIESSLTKILPVISLLAVSTIRLKQMASQIAAGINTINAARASIPDITRDVIELDAIRSRRVKRTCIQEISNFKRLSLDKVTYVYPGADVPAVHDITLELKSGESIALVGRTGCGKTTLLNLILGLLVPQSGCITVNGQDVSSNLEGWWGVLGYIPQSIFLINDTVSANIAFGVVPKEVDQERLSTALRSARLDEFVGSLRNGLVTIVGERGVRLSGGQRQRLGIARALYSDPAVLVMDEATAALDNKTEIEVMEAIQELKKERTLIMIAHRLSTVRDCDRLYYFREGVLDCVGTFQDVVKASDEFREMAKMQ